VGASTDNRAFFFFFFFFFFKVVTTSCNPSKLFWHYVDETYEYETHLSFLRLSKTLKIS